jgi:endonuclease G, mitochondrial
MPGFPLFASVSAASLIPQNSSVVPKQVNRISQIMKHGFPSLDSIRSFDDYVLSYDKRNRVPHWVFEHLTAENVQSKETVDRSKCDFKPDESIHPFFRFVR